MHASTTWRGAVLAALISLTAAEALAAGDADKGATLFSIYGLECEVCHPQERAPALGPSLCGVFGRQAGMNPRYERYSEAIKTSGIVWNEETLDGFLNFPFRFLPGTTMGFLGVEDPGQRADIIAYLERESDGDLCIWERQAPAN